MEKLDRELFDEFGPYLLSYWDLDSAEWGMGSRPWRGSRLSRQSRGDYMSPPQGESALDACEEDWLCPLGGAGDGKWERPHSGAEACVGGSGRGLLGGQQEGHPEWAQWLPSHLSEEMCGPKVWAG